MYSLFTKESNRNLLAIWWPSQLSRSPLLSFDFFLIVVGAAIAILITQISMISRIAANRSVPKTPHVLYRNIPCY